MTHRILIARGPEADHRPEKHITDAIVKQLREDLNEKYAPGYAEIIELDTTATFTELNDQKLFYDDKSMFANYRNVLTILEQTKPGDTIFFGDAWIPIMPAIKFYAFTVHGSSEALKLAGIFHSSVETPGDFFYGSGRWGRAMEAAIVEALDEVYVATKYGRNTIMNNDYLSPDGTGKIIVTGLPLTAQASDPKYRAESKVQKLVAFAHRWAEDKGPYRLIELYQRAKLIDPAVHFQVLHATPLNDQAKTDAEAVGIEFVLCPTREDYFTALSRAQCVISTAELETFGYAIIEGVQMGAVPFVPERACYPYLYAEPYMYHPDSNTDAIARQLIDLLEDHPNPVTLNDVLRGNFAKSTVHNAAANISESLLILADRA